MVEVFDELVIMVFLVSDCAVFELVSSAEPFVWMVSSSVKQLFGQLKVLLDLADY